jgi:hypothetical protein
MKSFVPGLLLLQDRSRHGHVGQDEHSLLVAIVMLLIWVPLVVGAPVVSDTCMNAIEHHGIRHYPDIIDVEFAQCFP